MGQKKIQYFNMVDLFWNHVGVSTDNHDGFLPNFVHEYKDLFVVFLLNMVNFGQVKSTLRRF